jgi:membrane-associated protein
MFDVEHLVQSGGILLIGLIVFAESGLLIGFFLPGDTLLFTAGFFAAQGKLSLGWLLAVIVAAAIVGDNVGYTIGKHSGKRIFKKKEGLFFRKQYVDQAQAFYERHGGKTIIIARFVPIVRTFAPVVAGIGQMDRKRFVMFNVIGAFGWGIGVTLLGYFLGTKIPNIDAYIEPVIGGAMLFAFAPTIFHISKDLLKRRRNKRRAAAELVSEE